MRSSPEVAKWCNVIALGRESWEYVRRNDAKWYVNVRGHNHNHNVEICAYSECVLISNIYMYSLSLMHVHT